VLAFASIATAHALLLFAQHWSVRIRCFVQYKPINRVTEGSYFIITPHAHQGKPEIVPVSRLRVFDADGSLRTMLWCVFQRQRYEYVEIEWDEARGKGQGELREIETPKDLPLSHYVKSRGLSGEEVHHSHERYGDNALQVNIPTFWNLYKEQLTGPVTVFQIFTVLLWLMDEYWKYALFSALSLLIFEGTTAFSRQRNIATLRGMGQKAGRILVRRGGVWEDHSTEELYPGDIISIKRNGGEEVPVPCDCVLLAGSAVVNEASLTGESVPQMKEHINPEVSKDERLDMNGLHKVHILYSGTTLMQHTSKTESESSALQVTTPDGGCLCYVLQTGFASTQGKLMRMMEFSSEQVTGDTKETLVLLFILLIFALAASYNVYVKGIADGKRSQYELILRCIMIVTSVVPPDLPMQTAMAVNTALIALVKASVYCTEPFRVPVAGKVDCCLFDKTGTITSDRLVAEGVLSDLTKGAPLKQPVEADKNVSIVIGGCHALLEIDGKTFGDPLEKAALLGIKWKYDPATHLGTPKLDDKITRSWTGAENTSVKILVRNHFASALQRMSVIADVSSNSTVSRWSLVKGSPEMIKSLLKNVPQGYDAAYRGLAEQGMRVIALAHKELSAEESARVGSQSTPLTRDEAESDLVFDGFFAFACKVRADSAEIIHALQASSNNVMMATGDATLTALHVGNEVGIARGGLDGALILARDQLDKLEWQSARVDEHMKPMKVFPYEETSIRELAKEYSLCVTGKSLNVALTASGTLWDNLDQISIYARMSPDDKERVLKRLKTQGKHTLMCGDGANDVGALKQAHVGVALLSGFEAGEKWAQLNAMKVATQRLVQEAKRRQAARSKVAGTGQSLQQVFAELEETDGEVPKVKLGDASMAAPFTSRAPSIKATADIIRQGRCTLVSAIQMQQVLMLSCLISAYSLSVLYLDGVRNSESQMMAAGTALTVAGLAFSYATPVHTLSEVRPLRSIFHPANFLSLFGQLVIHLAAMVYAVHLVKKAANETQRSFWEQGPPFEPCLLNTVVFLVDTVQRVCVMLVNYKGRPFMLGAMENKSLMGSMASMVIGAFVCAFEVIPWLNKKLQLVSMPD
ncbi:P-ATPase family transporter: cation, partial [Ostreococcus lucimarinus CCE9901]